MGSLELIQDQGWVLTTTKEKICEFCGMTLKAKKKYFLESRNKLMCGICMRAYPHSAGDPEELEFFSIISIKEEE